MKKLVSLILVSVLLTALLPVSALAEGFAPKDILIHEVNIEGFVPPVIGSTPEFSYTLYVNGGGHYEILYQYWHDNTEGHDMTTEQVPFVADHMYSIGCILYAEEGYDFAEDVVISFNGDTALADPDYPQPFYLGGCIVVQSTAVAPVEDLPAYEPGDVNNNGEVDLVDALLALRYSMGITYLNGFAIEAADMDGDGSVTAGDVLMIMRTALGISN